MNVLIIQARLGSVRLPNKMMLQLAGEPILRRVVQRALLCELWDKVVVAIPDSYKDQVLQEAVQDLGVAVFKGDEMDLVDRFFQCGMFHEASVIGRLPADNIFCDPIEQDAALRMFLQLGRSDIFLSNLVEINHSGYPDGLGIEVFSIELLESAWAHQKNTFMREHVHLNFVNYETSEPAQYATDVISPICPADKRLDFRPFDINTKADYLFWRPVYELLYQESGFEFATADLYRMLKDYQQEEA